jgi:hypothetical protein
MIVSLLLCLASPVDVNIDASIEQFKEFLATPASNLGTASEWPGYREIVKAGPNVLPILIKEIESTTQVDVRKGLCNVLRVVAQLKPYLSSVEEWNHALEEEQGGGKGPPPSWHRPAGVSAGGLRDDASRTLAWWAYAQDDERLAEDIDRFMIVRKTMSQEELLDAAYYSHFRKQILPYGIYAIPACIDLVATENDTAAFMHLLQSCRMDLYRALDPPPGIAMITQRIEKSYPDIESKLAVLCAWWRDNRHTYTELTELHEAIDSRMRMYCEEVKVTPPDLVH